jgi:pimeloyl-ACP methyl ester carboxylesterase
MLSKLGTAISVLRETWRLPRAPGNRAIFQHLRAEADERSARPKGLAAYLRDYPALGLPRVERDWYFDHGSGEIRLDYSSNVFASGSLRLRPGPRDDAVLVFLPGNTTGADCVFQRGAHPQSMSRVAEALGLGLACWDWPLQGRRREMCLYERLGSLYSGEREYSRILPALGSCLWRECVAELEFALHHLLRRVGQGGALHVVGWSMGACFAYVAPLLARGVRRTVAAGSCASVKDLLSEGKTKVHGFFFFPMNSIPYFDLDDVVVEALDANHRLMILFGEHDSGCLDSTARRLTARAAQRGHSLGITVIPGHGHALSAVMKDQLVHLLRR